MNNKLLVIDDDIQLVTDLRQHLTTKYQPILVEGPPELPLDLRGVREHLTDAMAIVLDLNIGGSGTYGQALLKKIGRDLKMSEAPVIIWSKYLVEVVLFGSDGIYRLAPAGPQSQAFQIIDEQDLEWLPDYKEHIKPLRKAYRGVRAFVSKASPDPAKLLCDVLRRLDVVAPLM